MKDIVTLLSELRAAVAEAGLHSIVPVAKDELAQVLQRLHEELHAAQWYPCDEMLPDSAKPVLLGWLRDGREIVRSGYWATGRGWRLSGDIKPRTEPTHWREMPRIGAAVPNDNSPCPTR